jgi:hypothetical protein
MKVFAFVIAVVCIGCVAESSPAPAPEPKQEVPETQGQESAPALEQGSLKPQGTPIKCTSSMFCPSGYLCSASTCVRSSDAGS